MNESMNPFCMHSRIWLCEAFDVHQELEIDSMNMSDKHIFFGQTAFPVI